METSLEKKTWEMTEDIWLKRKELIRCFFILFLTGIVVYFPILCQGLNNTYDGLWQPTYMTAGGWEISLGRWLWPYWDRLHFGIQSGHINTMFTIVAFALGLTLAKACMSRSNSLISVLAGCLFMANTVVCISLSYPSMSGVFGMAFLLSVAAAYAIIKIENNGIAIGAGVICLTASIGMYQAYICVFCLIALVAFFQKLEKDSLIEIGSYVFRVGICAVAGVALYVLILKAHIILLDVSISDYKGAAGISLGNSLANLKQSIARTYELFSVYFWGSEYRHSIWQMNRLFFGVVFAALGAALFVHWGNKLKERQYGRVLAQAAIVLALPIACLMILLAATEANLSMQMMGGLAMLLPVCAWTVDVLWQASTSKPRWIIASATVLTALALYGSVYMAAVDQEAMKEGIGATKMMANQIVQDLNRGEYMSQSQENTVMLLGRPSANATFKKGNFFEKANQYARVGRFWTKEDCMRRAWAGVFNKYVPINIKMCSQEQYLSLFETDEVQKMPSYPNEGYIRQIGDVVVVKVSDEYANVEE